MDADKYWLIKDFIGENKVLFKIPVYQRNYDWAESNCIRLLDDIKHILDSGPKAKHFLGTIVFMASKDNGFSLSEYIIIDGQQRLTTMMLFLKALCDLAEKQAPEIAEEIKEDFLHNKHCKEEDKIKLKPIKSDNEQYLALLNNDSSSLDSEGHISQNYNKAYERFEGWINSGYSCSQILEALEKLQIVGIELTKGEDDPQIIFESINSTGLDLTASDLIRNFLLMDAENQDVLYENYWLPIEKALKRGKDYSNLNMFFYNYVVYKAVAPVNNSRLYENFVKQFKDNNFTAETCLKELKTYAEIFQAFVYDEGNYNPNIKYLLRCLRQLKQSTSYPFLMHVFYDFENKVIDEITLEKILQFILSYLVKRMVCRVPSNSLRGLFIYLYNRIFKVESNKSKYYESINKFLSILQTKDAIPSDTDFKKELETSNFYNNSVLCRFVLMDLENGNGKEVLKVDNLTIEHIMPQTLNSDWRYISDEDHEQWCHTLGNLSVTGYNSELSNKSFAEKKEIIKQNSKAIILNQDVWNQETWTIDNIKSRAERLSEMMLAKYKIEKILDPSIEFEYLSTVTLDNYSEVTGKKLVSFKLGDEIYRQSYYALMLEDIAKMLDKTNPDKFGELAASNYSINESKDKHTYITTDETLLRTPFQLRDSIYIELNLSAHRIMKFIDALMTEFNFDKSLFSISIIAEEDDEEDVKEEL